jgi:hypothetical protein
VSGWLAPLGDADVKTTMRYVHIVGEADEDLGAKLEEYLRQFEENDAEATVEDDQDLAPVGDRRKDGQEDGQECQAIALPGGSLRFGPSGPIGPNRR